MEICTVNEYNAPADHRAIIANIRTSALAAGWTVEEYRAVDKVWDSGVGWASGAHAQERDLASSYTGYNGSFLQLQGSGFGNQGGANRWRLYGFKTDNFYLLPTNRYYNAVSTPNCGPTNVITYGQPTQSGYSATHQYNPTLQDNLLPMAGLTTCQMDCLYRQSTFPTTACIKQWVVCYGTKLIHSIVNIDNIYFEHTLFGVLDLFDQTYSDTTFFQKTACGSYGWISGEMHYSYYLTNGRGILTPYIYANSTSSIHSGGTVGLANYAGLNCSRIFNFPHQAYTNVLTNDYYDNIILQNTWSGKRVIHVPIVSTQLSGLLCPVGRMWYGVLNTENLTPGQILTYGAEQYQVWPVYSTTYPNTYGVAYRIA